MTSELTAQLQDFMSRLNKEPDPKELQPTPDGNAKNLPISYVEMTLDEIYLGQWSTSECTYQQVFNEVIGSIILTVVHPITGMEIKRAGYASIVITQDSGSKLQDFNTTKKKNALDLAFPKLKAECLKNAAASLGKIFGRDINRKQTDSYKVAYVSLSDNGFKSLIERIDKGERNLIPLAKTNFMLTDVQEEILAGLETKKLN